MLQRIASATSGCWVLDVVLLLLCISPFANAGHVRNRRSRLQAWTPLLVVALNKGQNRADLLEYVCLQL